MAMAPPGGEAPWPPGPPYTTMFLSPPSQSHHYYNDDTFISLKISIISAILQVCKKKFEMAIGAIYKQFYQNFFKLDRKNLLKL